MYRVRTKQGRARPCIGDATTECDATEYKTPNNSKTTGGKRECKWQNLECGWAKRQHRSPLPCAVRRVFSDYWSQLTSVSVIESRVPCRRRASEIASSMLGDRTIASINMGFDRTIDFHITLSSGCAWDVHRRGHLDVMCGDNGRGAVGELAVRYHDTAYLSLRTSGRGRRVSCNDHPGDSVCGDMCRVRTKQGRARPYIGDATTECDATKYGTQTKTPLATAVCCATGVQ